MPFGSSQWMYASGGFYNGVATQSARFDDGSSAHLTRTPSSAGNRKTWTWSFWFKRGNLGLGETNLLSCYTASNNNDTFQVYLNGSDQLLMIGQTVSYRTLTQLFRDTSAWYHLVIAIDTTQGTADNRIKVYVNGQQVTSFSAQSNPSQNADLGINQSAEHQIGAHRTTGFFDGYMAEINFVDGSQLDPTSFGEFKNGVWIPIEYTGSYGTNGFRLQFTGFLGTDTSGNGNNFTPSGFSADDTNIPDSPENNFCTLNPLNTGDAVLSEGNLKTPNLTTDTNNLVASTFQVANGKWYWEFLYDNVDADYAHIGITQTNGYDVQSFDNYLGYRTDQWSIFAGNGNKRNNQSFDSYGSGFSDNDIGMIALDMDNNKIWWGKNGTWFNSGDPASGTNAGFTNLSGEVTPALSSRDIVYYNFGQDSSFAGNATAQGNTDANGKGDFYYSPPSGYLALCSANLPEPTISPNADTQADDYFNTLLYTGDGNNTRSITGVGFQPDWVWLKRRSSAQNHRVFDIVRGSTEGLYTNLTDAEGSSQDVNGVLSSFDSDGFSTVNGSSGVNAVNQNTETYVAWNWKAGGTAVSNTDGTITSSVSANTDAGFSIVSYTGDGSASSTVGHGLSSADMIILKDRSVSGENWRVWHKDLSTNYWMYLNLTNAQASAASDGGIRNVDADTFGFINGTTQGVEAVNNSSNNYIAYCFAEISGYSSINSYIGNGSADGTFVYTGFRPSFVMVKRTSATQNWLMFDNKRGAYNPSSPLLYPNLSNSEDANTMIDFVSNGFKWRASNLGGNDSGSTFIYMAFAEAPFKYANAR